MKVARAQLPDVLLPKLAEIREQLADRRLSFRDEPLDVWTKFDHSVPDESIIGTPVAVAARIIVVFPAQLGADKGLLRLSFSGGVVDQDEPDALKEAAQSTPVMRYLASMRRDRKSAVRLRDGELEGQTIVVSPEPPSEKGPFLLADWGQSDGEEPW